MKSEERHQLLQNDLRVVTTKTVGFFERHAATMIAAVCVVLCVFAIVAWFNQTTSTENAAGWTQLDSATSLEMLGDVADKFKGKLPGQWAQLLISEKTLQSAMPLMFTNREIALADLKRCREGFDALLQDKTVPPAIRERALWGLALTLETGCDGDTAKPIEAYERLLSDFPDSIFKSVAEERIRSLKKPSSREFYSWFSKEKPKPPEPRPQDGMINPGFKMPFDEPADFTPNLPHDKKSTPDEKGDAGHEGGEKQDGDSKPTEKSDADKSANPEKPATPDKSDEKEKPTGKEPPNNTEKPTEKN